MARDENGALICPKAPHSDEVITESHHAELLSVGAIARQVMAGERQVPQLQFWDTTRDARSLQEALDLAELALQAFDELPPEVRLRVNHDPVRLQEMLGNEDGLRELTELGLDLGGAEEPVAERAEAEAPAPEEPSPPSE